MTAKQRAFAELLATWAIEGRDLNYTEAARLVGYKASKATRVSAHRLAQDSRVRALLDAALEKARDCLERKHGVTRERTIEELAHLGFARLADLVEWDSTRVTVKDSKTLTERAHAAVAEVSMTEHGIKVKMHRKTEALLAIARLMGYLADEGSTTNLGVQIILNGGPTGLEVTAKP
jgi:phage terminase small subunit